MKAILAVAVGAMVLVGCGVEEQQDPSTVVGTTEQSMEGAEIRPNGRGHGTVEGHARPTGGSTVAITYHKGPVMLGTINVYYIWYGNWASNTGTTILTDLAQNLGGSPYWNINTTYYNASNVHLSNSVAYAGSTTDAYSLGTALTDANIQTIVSSAITTGRLPLDVNGVYFVLTSADVNATSGFCTQYCGWHTHGTISGLDVKYSFVGNPDRCPTSCAATTAANSPNGNLGADGMASIISHELEETATDPDLNAWYDRKGAENADKCAWTFGTTYNTSTGGLANMKLGARDFLIQQNWVNSGSGFCAKSF